MPRGAHFDSHTHCDHQLAWASTGVVTVATATATWVLPPTRALWIPAGLPHEVSATHAATLTAAYLRPEATPINWTRPTPVRAGGLYRELVAYVARKGLDARCRERAEAVLVDILEPVVVATIELRMPRDARALDVAHALCFDVADNRSLQAWGHHVGASGRTLARAFLADTGITFGRWRTLLRLQQALPHLARGEPVGVVARFVGYQTPSAFVDAFRKATGSTPGTYIPPQLRNEGTLPSSPAEA